MSCCFLVRLVLDVKQVIGALPAIYIVQRPCNSLNPAEYDHSPTWLLANLNRCLNGGLHRKMQLPSQRMNGGESCHARSTSLLAVPESAQAAMTIDNDRVICCSWPYQQWCA